MPSSKQQKPDFESIRKSNDNIKNFIGISLEGQVFTWGKCNHLGQLGRSGKASHVLPAQFSNPAHEDRITENGNTRNLSSTEVQIKASKVYTGGTKDAGHSAVIDSEGSLWLTGCDRWQQLGLGTSVSGASGYTWKNGRLWHESFQKNIFLPQLMQTGIRDVAIGGDHTIVLSENQKDVYSFGKGAEGQLGIVTKPFVNCSARSKELSSSNDRKIAAVCAIRHCSFTLDDKNKILKMVGKCKIDKNILMNAGKDCQEKALKDGLVVLESSEL